MAENPPERSSSATRGGGLLGALGLSPKALLLVALLALLAWWYFQNHDMQLDTDETAVVVLGLALAVAAGRVVRGLVRRRRPPTRANPDEAPE